MENTLKEQPRMVAYGTTYYFCIENVTIQGGTLYLAEQAKQLQDQTPKPDVARAALLKLFAEGAVTESVQWYAIFRVLSQCEGFPASMPDFCKRIESMKLNVEPPCVYENWRKAQNDFSDLPKNVKKWNLANPNDYPKNKIATQRQLSVAIRLMAILDGAE